MHSSIATSRSTWWGQALQNNSIALVLAMIVVIPLLASPADSKMAGIAVVAFEGFALLLAMTLLWRCRWNLGREQIATFLRTGANTPVLLFMALVGISCAFAPNRLFAVQETIKIGSGVLLYFVVAYQFRQSKHLLMLVDTLIFLAIAVSFLTMAQYTLDGTVLSGTRGTLLFGNQQPLGSLLMILLPMVAVIALTHEQLSKRQIAAQIATVMTAGALLLAHTRSGWLGALTGLVVMGALVAYSTKTRNKSRSRSKAKFDFATQKHKFVLPLVLTIVVLGFGITLRMQNSAIFARASTMTMPSTDMSWQGRLRDWSGIVKMVGARPLTGWGIGQFPIYQHTYTGLGGSAGPIAELKARSSMTEQAHNFYLQTAADLGLPGLVLMVTVITTFLVQAVKRIGGMDDGIRRSLLIGSSGAIAAFAVDAFSSPSWQYGQVSMFLWLSLGAGVACLRPRTKHVEMREDQVTVSPWILRPLAIAAASLFFTFFVLPSRPAVAATEYKNGDKPGWGHGDKNHDHYGPPGQGYTPNNPAPPWDEKDKKDKD